MGRTNSLAAALAAECQAITGVATASAYPVDSIPTTPFMYVGPPKLTQVPGTWEERVYTFPLHYMVARVTEAQDQQTVNDALDLVLDAFRTGITAGGLAVSVLITAADTDRFYTLNGTDYQSIDFEVFVQVMQAGGYTS